MNTTRHTTVRRVATTVVLTGAAVLTATPALAGCARGPVGTATA